MEKLDPALYLVPTPLGNLEDITLRAIRVLKDADIIACEDTRHSGLLLQKLEIKGKKLVSYHEHNEEKRALELVAQILNGFSVALISDAGSPSISDPGYRLVNAAVKAEIKIVPLPGPTAFVPALSASGFPVHKFIFYGFPPQKKGRQTFLSQLAGNNATAILYESPHRLEKLLTQILEICGESRMVCIAREISKIHEEFLRGNVADVLEEIKKRQSVKGEIVALIAPYDFNAGSIISEEP